MRKLTIFRVRRYLTAPVVDMDGIKVPYEFKEEFKPCIERVEC